jgi:hypothetical protein
VRVLQVQGPAARREAITSILSAVPAGEIGKSLAVSLPALDGCPEVSLDVVHPTNLDH